MSENPLQELIDGHDLGAEAKPDAAPVGENEITDFNPHAIPFADDPAKYVTVGASAAGLALSDSGKAAWVEHRRGECWVPLSLLRLIDCGPGFHPDVALPFWFCRKEGIESTRTGRAVI